MSKKKLNELNDKKPKPIDQELIDKVNYHATEMLKILKKAKEHCERENNEKTK